MLTIINLLANYHKIIVPFIIFVIYFRFICSVSIKDVLESYSLRKRIKAQNAQRKAEQNTRDLDGDSLL